MATIIPFRKPETVEDRIAAAERREQDRHDAMALLQAITPEDAQSVVVAELRENRSDSQTDYYAHRVTRCVVLAFRTSKRNSFAAMRKAAATFEPTADLAKASKDAEHRENWSMGGGYYLKEGSRHESGWAISIEPLDVFHADHEIGPAL